MLLDGILGNDTLLGQELEDLITVIALKLDNLAQFFVTNDASVAAEVLQCGNNQYRLEHKIETELAKGQQRQQLQFCPRQGETEEKMDRHCQERNGALKIPKEQHEQEVKVKIREEG